MILQPFEKVTKVMSGSKYLTAGLAIENKTNKIIKNKKIYGVAKTIYSRPSISQKAPLTTTYFWEPVHF